MFKPIISHMTDEEKWRDDPLGLSSEIPWAFTKPEREGRVD